MPSKPHKTQSASDLDFWLAEWLKPTGKRRSEHTARAYIADIKQFIDQARKLFDQVAEVDIMEYQSYLTNQYDSEKTRARKLTSVCSFYKFLNNREVTNLNLAKIERASIERSIDHDNLLTEKEVMAIIGAVKADPLHYVLLRFLYLTGCRISEAISLRWRDLTPLEEAGEAHIIGKRRKVRKVFVPTALWNDLIGLRGEAGDKDHPFPFTASWAWKIVRRAGSAAGIENAHPHQFRHAFVSHLLAEGEEIVRVKEAVGHTNIATTSLYAHASGQKDLTRKLKVK